MPVNKFGNMVTTAPPDHFTDTPDWTKTFVVELRYFLGNVLNAVNSHIDGDISVIRLTEQTVEPNEKDDGTIVYADGTNWNPGGGEGFYGRVSGAWVKLH